MTALLIGIAVVALVIAIALASRSSGPRVTIIKHKTERKEDDE
jgi:Tfp pilus assembly protein FimT